MSANWRVIIPEAARIAESYSTPVTLRQLHYRLVASGIGRYENTQSHYKRLSALTAEGRREYTFPQLLDTTRAVHRPLGFSSPIGALTALQFQYRRNRMEFQQYQTWVIFEKSTLAAQIESWTRDHGIPTAALRGYSSESLEREILEEVADDGRQLIGYYVGDLDPEGEDIERNFIRQCESRGIHLFKWRRLGVRYDQIAELGLVPNPGKPTSTRAAAFIDKYGELFQVETEAIDPSVLERLVTDAMTDVEWFSEGRRLESLRQEALDRAALDDAINYLRQMGTPPAIENE